MNTFNQDPQNEAIWKEERERIERIAEAAAAYGAPLTASLFSAEKDKIVAEAVLQRTNPPTVDRKSAFIYDMQ